MIYEINDKVTIVTEKRQEKLDEIIRKFKKDNHNNIKEFYGSKMRYYNIFSTLFVNNIEVLNYNIFELIFLIEILKGFANNKLDIDKTYSNNEFECKITQKNKKIFIQIDFFKLDFYLYYDKVEANILSSQINKVIAKCEAKPENEDG